MVNLISKLNAQYRGFINTPLITQNDFFGMAAFHLPKDIEIGFQNFECSGRLNLGKRAEMFFEHTINQSKGWELLASNLQVIHQKKTLGEFDFFVENLSTEEKFHVELAYKFYVYDPNIPHENKRWIGPNRKDALHQKINKLKAHQLPLLYSEEAAQVLSEKGLNPKNLDQRVCLKAKLFVPLHQIDGHFEDINPNCIVGYWLHWHDFIEKKFQENHFFAPKKKQWFAGPEDNSVWKSFAEIKTDIQKLFDLKKSPLVYMKTKDNQFEQFFVVWW